MVNRPSPRLRKRSKLRQNFDVEQALRDCWRPVYCLLRRCSVPERAAEELVGHVVAEALDAARDPAVRNGDGFAESVRVLTQRKISEYFSQCPQAEQNGDCEHNGNGHNGGAAVDPLWQRDWQRNKLQLFLDRARREVGERAFRAFHYFAIDGCSAAVTSEVLSMEIGMVYFNKSRVVQRVRYWMRQEMDRNEQF